MVDQNPFPHFHHSQSHEGPPTQESGERRNLNDEQYMADSFRIAVENAIYAMNNYGNFNDDSDIYGGDQVDRAPNDTNPDTMTHERSQRLRESVENVSNGLSEELLSKLPCHRYKSVGSSKWFHKSTQIDECVICQLSYKRSDVVTTLPCVHKYHKHCIFAWLKINKECCLCKREVVIF